MAEASEGDSKEEYPAGVRLVVLNLPEDVGEGLGFRLTKTLWDPYPWVRDVIRCARADVAGLKTGDCLLQVDGRDLLGLPVGQVAGLIRGDGTGHGVSLLVWNCGVDPKDDPELLWSCGGGARGEKSRAALAGVVRALACCVCAATATQGLNCARSHLYCEACWVKLQKCALCREALPAKDSPYARNLVAEQVFEAIATEYEIKNAMKRPIDTASASASPNRSPAPTRRGQHTLSMANQKKSVQFIDKNRSNYASDPNIHRSTNNIELFRRIPNSTKMVENSHAGNSVEKCCDCKHKKVSEDSKINLQHKLVARLRPASSLVDLQNTAASSCLLSQSLNNVNLNDDCCKRRSGAVVGGSLDNLKNSSDQRDPHVLLLSPPPIYVITCEHE